MWQLSFLTGIAVVFGLGNIRKNSHHENPRKPNTENDKNNVHSK